MDEEIVSVLQSGLTRRSLPLDRATVHEGRTTQWQTSIHIGSN